MDCLYSAHYKSFVSAYAPGWNRTHDPLMIREHKPIHLRAPTFCTILYDKHWSCGAFLLPNRLDAVKRFKITFSDVIGPFLLWMAIKTRFKYPFSIYTNAQFIDKNKAK